MLNNNYIELLKDPRWQRKRLEILNRDEWTCQRCLNKNSTLNVHHKLYTSQFQYPWDYPNKLLTTLCDTCHQYEKDHLDMSINWVVEEIKSIFLSDEIINIANGLYSLDVKGDSKGFSSMLGWLLTDYPSLLKVQELFKESKKEATHARS